MEVVYGLIPMVLFVGFLLVALFIWMAKKGQFDDLDGAAHSIFMDDEFDENRSHPGQDKAQANNTKKAELTNSKTE